ncbi:MAG: radical SAM protein [Desulfobacteraceae bacterium]|jgi:radical SAM protein with 4Fe4S-binding SPASM domain
MNVNKDYFPYSVNIELTRACNLRCLHCGSTAGKSLSQELTLAEYDELFKGLYELGCHEVCLLGGEPFIRKDWYEIAQNCCDNGLNILFVTNGWLCSKEILNKLKRLDNVQRIGVSIDSAYEKEHDFIRGREGAFASAFKTAYALRDAGFETGIITTLSKINISRFGDLKDRLYQQNFTWQIQVAAPQGDRFDRRYVLSLPEYYQVGKTISNWRNSISIRDLPVCGGHDVGYFSQHFSNYSELSKWHGCGAGLYTLGVVSDGRIKGCLCHHDDFSQGNIRERSIVDIWKDKHLFLRNRNFNRDLLEGYCKDCPYGSDCRAGCSNLAYNITGSTYNNPYCFYSIEKRGIA